MDEPGSMLTPAPLCEPAIGTTRAVSMPPRSMALRSKTMPSQSLRRTPHDGRSGTAATSGVAARGTDAIASAARQFTEHALRLTLEVLDRRRAPAQLRSVLDPALVDVVRVLSNAAPPSRDLGAARLHRVHIRMTDPTTAEVFGSYTRGSRILALAAQVTCRRDGWRVSALRIA